MDSGWGHDDVSVGSDGSDPTNNWIWRELGAEFPELAATAANLRPYLRSRS
jgi:hypothetical protein